MLFTESFRCFCSVFTPNFVILLHFLVRVLKFSMIDPCTLAPIMDIIPIDRRRLSTFLKSSLIWLITIFQGPFPSLGVDSDSFLVIFTLLFFSFYFSCSEKEEKGKDSCAYCYGAYLRQVGSYASATTCNS